ncbi:MAG TPA: GntR family transcriptional regulator [Steroidobacteraceae bacterium]|nr:GntR family transcriptional regulator [Steroidobacteraceae bacterium]
MPRTLPIERRSLATQVADALRELIMSNDYEQGQQLRQDDIAKRLGVSHIPVREAFQLLEAEGLITNVPYKGAVVTRLSESEIEEYFDIRATLEVDLLRRAIGKLEPQDIERAREIVATMDSAPPVHWGEHNWSLHEALYAAAGRPITLEFIRRIHDNLDRYVRIQLSLAEENRQRAHQEHIQLIDLCEAGERSKALKLLSTHINGVRDDLLNHLKQHPPK